MIPGQNIEVAVRAKRRVPITWVVPRAGMTDVQPRQMASVAVAPARQVLLALKAGATSPSAMARSDACPFMTADTVYVNDGGGDKEVAQGRSQLRLQKQTSSHRTSPRRLS